MPSPSARAAEQVEAELKRFNAKLAAYVKAFEADTLQTSVRTAFEVEGRLKERTPVDTGRARASWHVVLPGQSDSYTYSDNRGRSFDGTLSEAAGPWEALVGSNVRYMLPLEAGHSQQAPQGMVRVTLREMRDEMRTAIKAGVPMRLP